MQKMAKCTFWYQLMRVIPDKAQRAVKWLCVCVDKFCYLGDMLSVDRDDDAVAETRI